MHVYFWNIAIRTLKSPAHLKMDVGVRPGNRCSFHIGTLVVVQKRAVIDYQTRVRLIVIKDVIANDLRPRQVVRQI